MPIQIVLQFVHIDTHELRPHLRKPPAKINICVHRYKAKRRRCNVIAHLSQRPFRIELFDDRL